MEARLINMEKINMNFWKGELQGISNNFRKADEMSRQKTVLNQRFATAERETIKAARKLGARNDVINDTPSNPQAQSPLATPEFPHSGATFAYATANGNLRIKPLALVVQQGHKGSNLTVPLPGQGHRPPGQGHHQTGQGRTLVPGHGHSQALRTSPACWAWAWCQNQGAPRPPSTTTVQQPT